MNSHHDLFFDELGHSAYRNLVRCIPDAYGNFHDGFNLTVGEFVFTQLERHQNGKATYSGKGIYKTSQKEVHFTFQLLVGESYLDSVYFTVYNSLGSNSKECVCDSHTYFHRGCLCGALPNKLLRKK